MKPLARRVAVLVAVVALLSEWQRGDARLRTVMPVFLLVAAVPLTDQAGFALAGIFFAWHEIRRRRLARAAG